MFNERSGKKRPLETPLRPLLPKDLNPLFSDYINQFDEQAREWIEKRLELDPDWFMPHYFWVKFRFKSRRKDLTADSVKRVSPPIFFEITAPKMPNSFLKLDTILRTAIRNKLSEKSIISLLNEINLNDAEFYESWKLIKHETLYGSEQLLRNIKVIFDEGLFIYYIEKKPAVNLFLALDDYLKEENVNNVVENIRIGKYLLSGDD
jgi:hypothetical protein